MTMGERIRELRKSKNMTMQDLADYLNTTKENIYKYEHDIITNIPITKLCSIAEKFNTSLEYIVNGTSKNNDIEIMSNLLSEIPPPERKEIVKKCMLDYLMYLSEKKREILESINNIKERIITNEADGMDKAALNVFTNMMNETIKKEEYVIELFLKDEFEQ